MSGNSELQVSRTLIDLLSEPRFHAERVSQAFWGEFLIPLDEKNEFVRVRRIRDQYEGWVDRRHVSETFAAKGKLYRLTKAAADVTAFRSHQATSPYRLLFGTEIPVTKIADDRAVVFTGSEAHASIKVGSLSPVTKTDADTAWKLILQHARFFLGAPYLWGGISHLGCDCSGLVQTLYGQVGIALPRDTRDQRKAGISVQREDISPGDLIFTPGHVVIALGKGKILHSSRSYGGVSIQSIDPKDDTYRKDLDDQFEEVRRVLLPRKLRKK